MRAYGGACACFRLNTTDDVNCVGSVYGCGNAPFNVSDGRHRHGVCRVTARATGLSQAVSYSKAEDRKIDLSIGNMPIRVARGLVFELGRFIRGYSAVVEVEPLAKCCRPGNYFALVAVVARHSRCVSTYRHLRLLESTWVSVALLGVLPHCRRSNCGV